MKKSGNRAFSILLLTVITVKGYVSFPKNRQKRTNTDKY